ncbi:DMT family transporter [Hyunsoonleella pacifica]|uniref:DMT family transporter n=1 Tax=Hyunsoonleella pacifica TaxID=1080224 RepID=A0A4Q9FMH2_9FLAO|nr:DMT family transporter [Hyunsoonleella pacifica]TBN13000.1 DMT family transporter [Hyunsoonleella pacifica]GGD27974.1 permease [Hyunsoonleella pacifica]
MLSAKFKNYLHLHLLVFIAGFTAILGKEISITAIPLVWFRMSIAAILMYLYIVVRKVKLKIDKTSLVKLCLAGIIIALHWITFFAAIDAANVSIALAMFSTGAFFASIIEPIFYKRKIIGYEILFGILVIVGVFIIMQSEIKYLKGIILGVSSAFFSSFFAVLNGVFLKKYSATVISFYEFISGVIFISIFILCFGEGFSVGFFQLSGKDVLYLFILASICTAYAFIAAVYVMKFISPFTVVLTYNLEPIYGIILAIILYPETERMSTNFYYGAMIIISTVVLNGILKNKHAFKRKQIH